MNVATMIRFRFRIATLLIAMVVVSIGVEPVSDYFGWSHPSRQVRQIMSFLDAVEDSVSYEDFKAEFKLPDLEDSPPMGGWHPDTQSGTWFPAAGYYMYVTFDHDILSIATIFEEESSFRWEWIRGKK